MNEDLPQFTSEQAVALIGAQMVEIARRDLVIAQLRAQLVALQQSVSGNGSQPRTAEPAAEMTEQ